MGFSCYTEDREIRFWYASGDSIMSGDEFHTFHEVLYIFSAEGWFLSEKKKTRLLPNTLILIPKETYHNFVFEENSDYIRCRIWFSDISGFGGITEECMNEIRVISEPGEVIERLFSELAETADKAYSEAERRMLLRSSVLRLLFEIKRGLHETGSSGVQSQSGLIQAAAKIINEDYCENISVGNIAARLFVSPSQLAHMFKKELNISIYKYITLKRILCAQKLIKSGVKANEAARQSGFRDYSSFYRVYRKHCGEAPCRNKERG